MSALQALSHQIRCVGVVDEVLRVIEDYWAHAMSRLIRVEMARLGWSYGDLLAGLERIGVTDENERNLRNKVARGTFSAVFLAQAMLAMEVKEVRLDGREIAAAMAERNAWLSGTLPRGS